jgi:hypothetical protein
LRLQGTWTDGQGDSYIPPPPPPKKKKTPLFVGGGGVCTIQANSYKTMLFSRIVMKLCLEMASGGLGGRVVYVASLNTTTVDHQSITSMVTV